MRRTAILVLALCLSSAASALPPEDTRHLLARAGFGAAVADFATFAEDDRRQAVRRLLDARRDVAETPPPDYVGGDRSFYMTRGPADAEAQQARQVRLYHQGRAMKGWWLQEMAETPSPLTERMVLFWHNHFVTSFEKVRDPDLLVRHNMTLRRHALGNFRDMLHAVAADPGMIKYLDTITNRRQGPNENFARELLELFTLGEGRYSEADIKEAARAFAGWSVDEPSGRFKIVPAATDPGSKTIFGHTGPFDGGQVLDLILQRPETAPFIVRKLWREFISDKPDEAVVAAVARRFGRDWDIAGAVGGLLDSQAFWADGNRGRLVKSPTDLMIGAIRVLGTSGVKWEDLALQVRQLGQDLFQPPNVRGWPGGTAWINTDTLLLRRELLDRRTRGRELGDAAAKLAAIAGSPRAMDRLLLATAAVGPLPDEADERLAAILLDPAYQVK